MIHLHEPDIQPEETTTTDYSEPDYSDDNVDF